MRRRRVGPATIESVVRDAAQARFARKRVSVAVRKDDDVAFGEMAAAIRPPGQPTQRRA
jgi:hypothetical protein